MDMFPMLFNYSVIDCYGGRKLPYYWIQTSQQEIALMAVRKEIGGELALYAANDTLLDCKSEYTVTAYNEDMTHRTIASGIFAQKKNSSSLIQRVAEDDKPQLWIIKWNVGNKTCFNHVFTGKTSYEVMKNWIEIIETESGNLGKFPELKS